MLYRQRGGGDVRANVIVDDFLNVPELTGWSEGFVVVNAL